MAMPSLIGGVNRYPKKYLDTYGIGGTSLDSRKPSLLSPPEEAQPISMPESGVGTEDMNATAALTRPVEQDYSYGVESPKAPKEKWWQTLLDYAIPTVIGASEGHGVIPSLGYAHLLREANKGKQLAAAQKAAGEERKFRQNERQIDAIAGLRRESLDLQKENAKALAGERQDRRDERAADRLDKQVEKLGVKMGNIQEVSDSINGIEKQIGFNLDDYDQATNSAKTKTKDGIKTIKDVDLPGVSTRLPIVGRVSFYSGGARDLNRNASRLFNIMIRDRSGQAVTNTEMERIKEEFSRGDYNSEPELISAMKEYKSHMRRAMQNIESSFNPESVREYEDRGGVTSNKVSRGITGGSSGPDPAAIEEARRRGLI